MTHFSALWRQDPIPSALSALRQSVEQTIEQAVAIQQIAAPTFHEAARAREVEARLQALGLEDLFRDEMENVYARLPGREAGPAMLVTAHLDTVFSLETDLATCYSGDRLYGPGIGDNSMGVAGLLSLAARLRALAPRRDIWFVANVGEEGLGNLRGMRAAMARLQPRVGAVVVLEGGAFGTVIHRGIGVERRRLSVEVAGGHAWSNFGQPSAIHELCRVGAAIADLEVPSSPRTSFNLGTIEGGTSVNTIAAHASALLDLRSELPDTLAQLAARVDAIVEAATHNGTTIRSETIGERPAGGIAPDHPLVRVAVDSLGWLGYTDALIRAASTDANVPLARGVPAVCIGLTVGHNAHRLDEYIDLKPLPLGLQHAFLVIWTTVESLL